MTMIPNHNCYVFACGMERSGSSVYMRMIHMLIRAAGLGQKVGDTRLGEFLEVTPIIMAKAEAVAGLKLIRAHDYHPLFAAEFERNNAIGFYVWRDIRDVMVSFTLRESCEHTLDDEDWVIANVKRISANYLAWTGLGDKVMVSTYEELITNKAGLLHRTGQALDIRINEQQASAAAAQFSPEKMREQMPADHQNDGRAGMWRERIPAAQADRLQEIVDEYGLNTLQVEAGPVANPSVGRG